MNKLFSIALALGLTTMTPTAAFADVNCTPIYGGGQTCVQTGNLVVHKQVSTPGSDNNFQDGLDASNPFHPGDQIAFRITLQNTGGQTISSFTLQDILPSNLTFISGTANRNFSVNGSTLSEDETNLKPNETRQVTFKASVGDIQDNQLCEVNQAQALMNGTITNQNNVQFCIVKPVLGAAVPTVTKGGKQVFPQPSVVTTPPTGPEALPLLALLPTGILGYITRKKAIRG